MAWLLIALIVSLALALFFKFIVLPAFMSIFIFGFPFIFWAIFGLESAAPFIVYFGLIIVGFLGFSLFTRWRMKNW